MAITNTSLLIVAIVVVILGLLRFVLPRLGARIPSWKSYLRGQGAILLSFLLIGGLGAGVTVRYGPSLRNLSRGGKLLEYRAVDPSVRMVYGAAENIENYSALTVFTRAVRPDQASAIVSILRSRNGETSGDITSVESISTSWTRLELQNSSARMRLVVEPPTNPRSVPATQVEVLIYLRR